MRPTVGRIVLYHFPVGSTSVDMPAIVICAGSDDTVDLEIFGVSPDLRFARGVPFDDARSRGGEPRQCRWSWPPRV